MTLCRQGPFLPFSSQNMLMPTKNVTFIHTNTHTFIWYIRHSYHLVVIMIKIKGNFVDHAHRRRRSICPPDLMLKTNRKWLYSVWTSDIIWLHFILILQFCVCPDSTFRFTPIHFNNLTITFPYMVIDDKINVRKKKHTGLKSSKSSHYH